MKPAVSIAAAVLLVTFAASAFASPGSGAAPAAPLGSPPLPRHGMSAPLLADTLAPGWAAARAARDADCLAEVRPHPSRWAAWLIVWRDTVDATGAKTQFPYTQREVMTRMRPSWLRRFTRALLNDSTALSDQLCPPSQLPDGAQPWMTTVLWFSTKSRGQVYLNFFGNCGFAGVGLRAGRGLDHQNADTLLGMMRGAAADSALRDYRAARRLAMAAGGGEVLPKFGEYVQVETRFPCL